MKKNFLTTDVERRTAVLVALITQEQPAEKTQEYLDELKFLATTLEVDTLRSFTQSLDKPDAKTFVRKGKLEEIKTFVTAEGVDLVIFDEELSPSQVRNLEKEFPKGTVVMDRSLLILEIFKGRAKTAQARTQVELAEYQYLLPRLTRMWTHLSRQRGGIGQRGGAGEKEIETDRRIVRDRIALLRKQLDKFETQSAVRRKSRQKEVRVALVGYTNVGKSTLMRRLTKADVFAENKLFATVDSTVRKTAIHHIPFLLSDTVGFIRKLPTTLIESFKSTLAEIVEADILLHVVDLSHESFEEQIEIVEKTLQEIGATDKPTVLVFNKLDRYEEIGHAIDPLDYEEAAKYRTLSDLKNLYAAKGRTAVFVSAMGKRNLDTLRETLYKEVSKAYFRIYPNYMPENEYLFMNGNGLAQNGQREAETSTENDKT